MHNIFSDSLYSAGFDAKIIIFAYYVYTYHDTSRMGSEIQDKGDSGDEKRRSVLSLQDIQPLEQGEEKIPAQHR